MDPFLPTPEPARWRRGFLAACIAIPFTAMQIWAVVVLLSTATIEGPAGVAFLLAVAGSIVAVLDGWRWAWRLGRSRQPSRRAYLVTG
ncbi:MAG: hypothetical protein ABW224_18820 [Kibdelosporangium sp.]